jgi:hypothetical protein
VTNAWGTKLTHATKKRLGIVGRGGGGGRRKKKLKQKTDTVFSVAMLKNHVRAVQEPGVVAKHLAQPALL